MKYKSIGEMFFAKRDISPKDVAFKYKENGEWKSLTYEFVINESEKIAAGLASLGIKKGDKIAIISANRIEWALIDYADRPDRRREDGDRAAHGGPAQGAVPEGRGLQVHGGGLLGPRPSGTAP